ncbi:MAG: argininosuccinate lyase, partial [Pseudomonadota bacterium]
MSSSKNSLANKSKAWSGRFAEPVDTLVQHYTSSLAFDQRLALVDIAGSLAHAEMLAAQKIISKADFMAIQKGMAQIEKEIVAGRFDWQLALEDVHLNIEARLTKLIGDAGKRLHTGRSRNDQVATDIRLWLRSEIDLIQGDLTRLREAFLNLAEQHANTIMPGHTHLQVAQPV